MITRYSIYQIFSKGFRVEIHKPKQFNLTLIKLFCVPYSILNPFRFLLSPRTIHVSSKISYEEFRACESKSNRFRLRLYMDEEMLKWRYLDNNFHRYLFLRYAGSLLIVRVENSIAVIVDIYVQNVFHYLFLLAYLLRTYSAVIFHGNFFALYNKPYIWVNLLVGFVPFIGGGSFVECNDYAKRISWRGISLLDSWGFGL